MSRLDPPRLNRRSFLSLASLGSFFAAMGTAAVGMLRLPNPAVLPGPVRRFKLGPPEQFSAGSETPFAEQNLVLFRDDEGFYAISSTCTHLGCTVARSKEGFACPCHGSRFSSKGSVVGGPAPRPLPWLEVSRAANGDLIVNADNEVPEGTRYRVSEVHRGRDRNQRIPAQPARTSPDGEGLVLPTGENARIRTRRIAGDIS